MGIYLNPENTAFKEALNSRIYIDKSGLISYTNSVLCTQQKYICVSRPRRFGKSMAADMLAAYYSKGCDSREVFAGRKAALEQIKTDIKEQEEEKIKSKVFRSHLNQHNVIRLDIQQFLESERDLNTFIPDIESAVIEELLEEFPDCKGFDIKTRLKFALSKIFKQTKKGFVFIIDEWDCVFRLAKEQKEVQKEYLDFLRGLFKGHDYVELAYMTGILPVKKYGEHSAINIFDEFSMIDSKALGEYFGFTGAEVEEQCRLYKIDYTKVKQWYDGYFLGNLRIYNPKSVVDVLTWKEFQSYWTGTETYEALKVYIDLNYDGLKEAVIKMLGNCRCKINPRKFQNDMTTFKTKDDILTLLVHLGYLTYDKKTSEVFIPNQEVAQEFLNAVDEPCWNGLISALERSKNLLESTWRLDEEAVAQGVAVIHNETASILKYNDKNSLTCTVLMAYYGAKVYYMNPIMELPSGKGYADVVYLPKKNIDYPALLIELKWNKSAKGAIAKIKDKQYISWIKEYTGDILLVGINYDENKGHECLIEKYTISNS